MMRLLVLPLIAFVAATPDQGGPVIATMDEMKFTAPKDKGTAELVEGKFGKAVRFSLIKDARGAFFTSTIRGNADGDKADDFSFYAISRVFSSAF